ncbi:hypothetical protein AA987_02885 [Enterococcus cecorum]|nr:hypothetical protein AA987_02885 [Enterococcus cecorum]
MIDNLLLGAVRPASHPWVHGVQQLDIVKFALPLEKISFHPIFSAVGKHTNFFMSEQAASRPKKKRNPLGVWHCERLR